MKVLHVIASIDPRGGGPAEGIRQIAAAARQWGQQTTVACLDAPGQAFLEGNPFDAVALGPARGAYRYAPRLLPWLRENAARFDAVIVDGLWQYHGRAAWSALHGGSVPYFVFTHGMLDPYFKRAYPLKHAKKWVYWNLVEHRLLRDARAVFFTCEQERLLASTSFRRYRATEDVVGLGTAPAPFSREVATAAFYAAYPQLRDKRIVLFLGRVHEKKGADLLIEAFAGIAPADPRWHLVMAGPADGALGGRLRALVQSHGIAERVTWTGMITHELKWGALYGAEVFGLTSHQENFGISVVEAMACGTPVLISDQVNIWREIAADRAGLVAPDTPVGARELLQRWSVLDEFARHKMRLKARACFETRFDIRQVARQISNTLAARLGTAQRA